MNEPRSPRPSGSFELQLQRELAEPESEFHLADYLRILTGRWRLIVVVTLLAALFSVMRYAITPKEYRATTLVQIDRRVSVPMRAVQDAWMESFWNMEYYPTQYRLLSSRGLAERVVLNLRLAEDARFHAGAAAGAGSPAADEALVGALANRLLGGLEVAPVRNTMLVEISFRSGDPELAARVANGVADAYIDWGIESRTEVAGKASTFFAQQIEALKQEIQDKENQLQAYSRRTDIVSLDPATNVTLRKLEALNQDYISAVSERIGKEARVNELVSTPPDRAAEILSDPAVSQQRAQLLEMERDYAVKSNVYKPEWPAMVELQAKIEQARRNLRTGVTEALEKARETARADYQNTLRREQSLAAELNRVKSENRELNSAAVEYNNLQVEISTRRGLLDELLRKQSETDVASRLQAQGESNVRIVDRALVPGGPFRPSLRRSLTLGLGGGLMAGLGLVLLLHYMDRTLKSTEEVERVLELPVLATIPDVSSDVKGYGVLGRYGYGYGYGHGEPRKSRPRGAARIRKRGDEEEVQIELLPLHRPRLAVAEAYRTLRTALLLSSTRELKLVLVTSAVPSEGKTSTAANLAVVMAQLGKQVLLVDADLRKPRVHEVFKIANRTGLVTFLTQGAEVEQVVFRTQVDNLHLTPSGPIPPNPSELLSSDRMGQYLDFVRDHFDLVIFDTAPTLAVTDGIILGARVDGTVLCLRAGHVQRRDARTCRDRLLQGGVKLLGTVLNRHHAVEGRYRGGYVGTYEAYGAPEPQPGKGGIAAL